jgi:imidazolonepropionase-like amidohydrolase
MKMKARLVWSALFSLALLLGSIEAVAQSTPTVIKGKKIYTVTNGTIENGEILIEDGKIKQVGTKVNAPAGARELSAEVVIPGMIDAHSHGALDRSSQGRIPGPVTSEWKAVEHFNPNDPMIPIALSGGVTSMITRSGSGIISSGQAVAVKLRSDPSGEPALNAAWAFRNGTPEQEALKMLTLHAAEMAGMEDRIGSIDVGKDADFMILEGHPFDYRVLPQMVFIDGELVFRT